jgi:hypothetical protein
MYVKYHKYIKISKRNIFSRDNKRILSTDTTFKDRITIELKSNRMKYIRNSIPTHQTGYEADVKRYREGSFSEITFKI